MSLDPNTWHERSATQAEFLASQIEDLKQGSRPQTATVAIVVTFNRKQLLLQCIHALLSQSADCDILIVDNNSSDGTGVLLTESGLLADPRIHHLRLRKNLGGAGGFAAGLWYAVSRGWEWMWIMDDDAVPDPRALGSIMAAAPEPGNVYGSVAVDEVDGQLQLCWPILRTTFTDEHIVHVYEKLLPREQVVMLPFLGFCIHRDLVERCGLPDMDLFIHGDDVEYCCRLRSAGAKIIAIRDSIIRHPVPPAKIVRFPGYPIYYKTLPPWKRYYEVRNRLVIARRYYSWRLLTQTVPGILARATISLLVEHDRLQQARAYVHGLVDGILGRLGRRSWRPE